MAGQNLTQSKLKQILTHYPIIEGILGNLRIHDVRVAGVTIPELGVALSNHQNWQGLANSGLGPCEQDLSEFRDRSGTIPRTGVCGRTFQQRSCPGLWNHGIRSICGHCRLRTRNEMFSATMLAFSRVTRALEENCTYVCDHCENELLQADASSRNTCICASTILAGNCCAGCRYRKLAGHSVVGRAARDHLALLVRSSAGIVRSRRGPPLPSDEIKCPCGRPTQWLQHYLRGSSPNVVMCLVCRGVRVGGAYVPSMPLHYVAPLYAARMAPEDVNPNVSLPRLRPLDRVDYH